MVYVDASVLAAYYSPETLSEKVEAFLLAQDGVAISNLTELELFSALSRKVREKTLERSDAAKIAARFLTHVDGRFFEYIPVESHHFRLARDWIGLFSTGLRSLDALHLAVAASIGALFATADQSLFRCASAVDVEAILIQ